MKSDRSDGHIIGLETGAVLARSVRRKVEGNHWKERALKMVTGTPWNPRPGEAVVSRRYTCFGGKVRSNRRLRGVLSKESAALARFELLYAQEDGPVEVRAQEGQPAPPDPAAPNLVSTSTAATTGGVAMETEDTEQAVSGQAPATAAPI